jgi:ElaB/YqjD/DUF883 family membrane-anchored ribosome-binding protein
MVTTLSAHSQPIPAEASRQAEPCPPDCDLPENSKENLDARLDHAIEETFPTSDPISVVVTKQATAQEPGEAAPAASSGQSREGQDQAEQETAEQLLDQVREALQDVAQTASGTARAAYREGQRHLRQARDRYPEAARSFQESRRAVRQQVTENPWPWLLMVGAVGYALAWMIHSKPQGQRKPVPDHARTRGRYAPHRN